MKSLQTGRSMIEMLGVLAIIGVISIGFLLSYRYAIDKYKADATLDEISRRHVVLSMQYAKGYPLNMDEFASTTQTGYPVQAALKDKDIGAYSIKLTNVPLGVCRHIVRSNYPALIIVNDKMISDEGYGCADDNDVEFVFVEGINWCERMDEQGNCCDAQGKCCPRNKPLINSSGKCVSCIGEQSVNVSGYEYTCGRCENRDLVGNMCKLRCPEGSYRKDNGECISCDEVWSGYIARTEENVARVLACPKVTLDFNHNAGHCDYPSQVLYVRDHLDTCAKCPNRELVGNMCALPCPEGSYRKDNGECISCDEVWSGYIARTEENVARVLACPKVTLDFNHNAGHCDYPSQVLYVRDHLDTCAKCPNRELVGDTCVLK